ncbi:MAG TPA: response regulator [Thermomicrobiales bacterium]|nr:response regulator [Thermomicrobiales bacterium]
MTAQDRPSSPNGNGQHRPAHILVINDTKEILELFRELLEDEGYRVSLSSFAVNDLDEVVALAPDLVILDFIIGGEEQGWQMLQKMRMDRRTARVPIIVCSAARNLVREIEGHLFAKNIGIVLKPFDIDELVAEVRRRLERDDTSQPHVATDDSA